MQLGIAELTSTDVPASAGLEVTSVDRAAYPGIYIYPLQPARGSQGPYLSTAVGQIRVAHDMPVRFHRVDRLCDCAGAIPKVLMICITRSTPAMAAKEARRVCALASRKTRMAWSFA